jgi:hypothetical protein
VKDMNNASIDLRIERLVLDGIDLPHRQYPLLQASVEAELGRLLATNGLAPRLRTGGTLPHVDAGTIDMPHNHDPTTLGRQIARALYRGFGR